MCEGLIHRVVLDESGAAPNYWAMFPDGHTASCPTLLDAVCYIAERAPGVPVNLAETDIGYRLFNDVKPRPCLHFVGFKDDRWWNAVKVFGKPDFVHRIWDMRALREIWDEGDIVVFADQPDAPSRRSGNDITEWVPREQSHDDSALYADPRRVIG